MQIGNKKLLAALFTVIIFAETTYQQDTLLTRENDIPIDSVSVNQNLQKKHTDLAIFKSGEAVLVQIFPDSSSFLNGVYKIDDRGCIDFPIIGIIKIEDLSEKQLVDTIKMRCIDYLPFPNIRISSLIRLSLFGGFFKPGLYWIDSRNSLWDAVQMAGGLQREDGLKILRWERDGKVVSSNLIDIFQSGVSLQKAGFRSGDQLTISSKPKSQFFREYFIPFTTLLLTTLTTAISIYSITQED